MNGHAISARASLLSALPTCEIITQFVREIITYVSEIITRALRVHSGWERVGLQSKFRSASESEVEA